MSKLIAVVCLTIFLAFYLSACRTESVEDLSNENLLRLISGLDEIEESNNEGQQEMDKRMTYRMGKRMTYRMGKRGAMPYRFGKRGANVANSFVPSQSSPVDVEELMAALRAQRLAYNNRQDKRMTYRFGRSVDSQKEPSSKA